MFGMFYEQRDRALSGAGGRPTPTGVYAKEVLAGILNRASAVEVAWQRYYEAHEADREDAVIQLARVTGVFIEDLDEARTRGLRGRLFRRDHTGMLFADQVDASEDLKDLGGELVSAERALAEG